MVFKHSQPIFFKLGLSYIWAYCNYYGKTMKMNWNGNLEFKRNTDFEKKFFYGQKNLLKVFYNGLNITECSLIWFILLYSELGLVSHLPHAFSGADPSTESSSTLEETLHLDLIHKDSKLDETLVLGNEMPVDLNSLTSEKKCGWFLLRYEFIFWVTVVWLSLNIFLINWMRCKV